MRLRRVGLCSLHASVVQLLSCWTIAHQEQNPMSVHGIFPGRNTGVGCHFLFQGNLPNPATKTGSPAWQMDSLPLSHMGSPILFMTLSLLSGSVFNGSDQMLINSPLVMVNNTYCVFTVGQHRVRCLADIISGQPYKEGPTIIPILQMRTENLDIHDQLCLILFPLEN